jgi:uncharacterized protein
MTLPLFHPFDQLAATLLDAPGNEEDGSHDLSHLVRVWRNAKLIHAEEGGDLEILAAAVLLHDSVSVAKDSPLRSQASRLAAKESRVRLAALGWESARIFCGIARCFYTAGRMSSRLYDFADPEGKIRSLDDSRNALDHFPKKLLTLAGSFKTRKGQELARERHQRVLEFYRGMLAEAQE